MPSARIGSVSCRFVGVGRGEGAGEAEDKTMEGPTLFRGSVVAGWAWPLAPGQLHLLSFSWDFTRVRPAPR